jgi:hypothetical protein
MASRAITDKQFNALVALLKKDGVGGTSVPKLAEAVGITTDQTYANLFEAELEADPNLQLNTANQIVKAIESGDYRWPRIAAYTKDGLSVAQVKALYKKETGKEAPNTLTKRGGGGRSNGASPAKAESGAGQSGRRRGRPPKTEEPTQARGTTGRRRGARSQAAEETPAAPARGRGRRGSRAAASANPQ